jgi:hypothetical protein
MVRRAATNMGFASGGVTCKLGAMCFYSSSVLVDSFVLRNPPERKARKRCMPLKKQDMNKETVLIVGSSGHSKVIIRLTTLKIRSN